MTHRHHKKTPAMQRLEHEHGTEIRRLLIDTYAKTGTLKAAGKQLGRTESCMSYWFKLLDIPTRRTVDPVDFLDMEQEAERVAA